MFKNGYPWDKRTILSLKSYANKHSYDTTKRPFYLYYYMLTNHWSAKTSG